MNGLHPVHQEYINALAQGDDTRIPLGGTVLCDGCDEDFTSSDRAGGFLFGSYAYGPCCVIKMLASIKGYGEEWNIKARCPDGMSFAGWVRWLRGPDAAIQITHGRGGSLEVPHG